MEAIKKAELMMERFEKIINHHCKFTLDIGIGFDNSKEAAKQCVIENIRNITETKSLIDGDYKMMGYEHEWENYSSYWLEVLNAL